MPVNWCPALGTVLANEEVVDGVSERGGHPVIRKVCVFFHVPFLQANKGIKLLRLISKFGLFIILQCPCLPSSPCGNGCSGLLHMLIIFLKI